MPEISLFYGIRVTMYYEDHNPPHFHAEYNGNKAIVDIIPSRQSLHATYKTEIHQAGGMCDMLTDQNYAVVEAALTEGTMPTDSRSIVIDYNVLKQNEDMGVGSTVDFYFGEGQPPVSVTVSGLFDSNKTPSGHGKLALDGVLC